MNAGSPSADRGAFPRPVGLPKGLGGGRGGTRWRRGGHGARHLQAVSGAGRQVGSEPTVPCFGSGLSREGPGALAWPRMSLASPVTGDRSCWLLVDRSGGGSGVLWGAGSPPLCPSLYAARRDPAQAS